MWTQRDQIQAYQFLRRRLVSALVSADANHPVSPSRRLMMGTVLGLVATLLVTAGFGVLRILKPNSGADWKKPGQVIIEKETGTRYILSGDGLLHPVLNFASARLLAGGDGSKTSTVAAKTLGSVGRGASLGIVGAPDSVPSAGRLAAGPATMCTFVAANQPADVQGESVFRWGAPLAGRALTDAQGLLVSDGDDPEIVTNGYRYRIPNSGAAGALGLEGQPVTKVSPAWLSAVPAGVDLALLAIGNAGTSGPSIAGRPRAIGTVLKVTTATSAASYYLVLAGGITPISPVQAALIVGNSSNRRGGLDGKLVTDVSPDQLAPVVRTELPERLAAGSGPGQPPALSALPIFARLASSATPLCLVMPATGPAGFMLASSAAAVTSGAIKPPLQPAGSLVADDIAVPSSTGGLVTTSSDNGATTYLLSDSGMKYLVSSKDALTALGYAKITPVALPSAVLAMLPTGPNLDTSAAQRPVSAAAK